MPIFFAFAAYLPPLMPCRYAFADIDIDSASQIADATPPTLFSAIITPPLFFADDATLLMPRQPFRHYARHAGAMRVIYALPADAAATMPPPIAPRYAAYFPRDAEMQRFIAPRMKMPLFLPPGFFRDAAVAAAALPYCFDAI
jgi:hypothetical protein